MQEVTTRLLDMDVMYFYPSLPVQKHSNELLEAARVNSMRDLNQLIEISDITVRDGQNRSLLHYMCYHNNSYMFTRLASTGKISFDIEDAYGYKCYHYAAYNGNTALIQQVTNKPDAVMRIGAMNNKLKIMIQYKDRDLDHALNLACFHGREEAALLLLTWGASINYHDRNGNTCLHLAASQGHSRIIKKLLLRGASGSIQNNLQLTAYQVCKEQSKEAFKSVNFNLKQACCQMNVKLQRRSYLQLGILLVFITLYNIATVYVHVDQNLDWVTYLYFTALAILLGSVLLAVLFEPGYVMKKNSLSELLEQYEMSEICVECSCLYPEKSKHCDYCGHCIIKYDHHCPWINNCVGRDNWQHFILFIFCLFGDILFSIILLSLSVENCMWISVPTLVILSVFLLPLMNLMWVQFVNWRTGLTTFQRLILVS